MTDFIPKKIDKYEIIKKLGKGNFSDVYLANDTALDTKTAIKVIGVENPELVTQKLEEAQFIHKCQHQNIVRVNSAMLITSEKGLHHIIIDMEYMEAGSIEDRMRKCFISVIESVNYIRYTLFALEHAHFNDILHHDIKPGNIMLSKNIAKLADFGLASLIQKDAKEFEYGYFPHYAPERLLYKKTSIKTDIYALGLTFFRIACNLKKEDWDEFKKHEKFTNKVKEGKVIEFIEYAPYIPRRIKRIINKACHHDYRKRFENAREMNQALTSLKPHIDWKMSSLNIWQGKSVDGSNYEILLLEARKFKVDLKKNNRKVTKDCKVFDSKEKALGYFYKYISETTFGSN